MPIVTFIDGPLELQKRVISAAAIATGRFRTPGDACISEPMPDGRAIYDGNFVLTLHVYRIERVGHKRDTYVATLEPSK